MEVAVPLAKNMLAPLGITAAASAITRLWNNNLNNLKQRNELHNKNCSSS